VRFAQKLVLNQWLLSLFTVDTFEKLANTCGLSPAQVFDETLATLFNAPGGGQLYAENQEEDSDSYVKSMLESGDAGSAAR